jgi:hypothetical protein
LSKEQTTEQDINCNSANHDQEIDQQDDPKQETNPEVFRSEVVMAFLGDSVLLKTPLDKNPEEEMELLGNPVSVKPSFDKNLEEKIKRFNERAADKEPSKEAIELQETLNFLKSLGAEPSEHCPQFVGHNTYQVRSLKQTIDNLRVQPGYMLVTATPQMSLLEDQGSIVKTTSQHDPTALVLKSLTAPSPGAIVLLKTQTLGVPFNLQYKDEEGNSKTFYCHIVRADDVLAVFRHDNTQALTQPSSPDA